MKRNADRVALGARLKETREYLGFSQEQVAKYLGVPRSAISFIEAGTRRVDALELARIAKLYQRSVGELTGEDQPNEQPESIKLVARAAAELSPEDQTEVLRFAKFLQARRAENQK